MITTARNNYNNFLQNVNIYTQSLKPYATQYQRKRIYSLCFWTRVLIRLSDFRPELYGQYRTQQRMFAPTNPTPSAPSRLSKLSGETSDSNTGHQLWSGQIPNLFPIRDAIWVIGVGIIRGRQLVVMLIVYKSQQVPYNHIHQRIKRPSYCNTTASNLMTNALIRHIHMSGEYTRICVYRS